MLHGQLRNDEQAVVELELVSVDGSIHSVSAVIDTGFNGQVSLSRRRVNEFNLKLTREGTIEIELASGTVIEEDVYSGAIRFDGQELVAEVILTDAEDSFVGTGLLTGKVLFINFFTREVTVRDYIP
jgi:clan AA aspartic protease